MPHFVPECGILCGRSTTRTFSGKVRKDKDEKRRAQLAKQADRQDARIAKYGSGSVVSVAADVNRRFVAAFLTLVFVLTTLVFGINISSKAAISGDQIAQDGTYNFKMRSNVNYEYNNNASKYPEYTGSVTVADGVITQITMSCTNLYNSTTASQKSWDENIKNGIHYFLDDGGSAYQNYYKKLLNQPASLSTIDKTITTTTNYKYMQYVTMKNVLWNALAQAEPVDDGQGGDDEHELPDLTVESAIHLNKKIAPNNNGTYDITLEAYSSADLNSFTVKETVPTDYVLVIDQSGSMEIKDMPTSYSAISSAQSLETLAEGNYYYKVGGEYYRVYGKRGYLYDYHEPDSLWMKNFIDASTIKLDWFQGEETADYDAKSLFFVKNKDGDLVPLVLAAKGYIGAYGIKLTAQGESIPFQRPTKPVYRNVFSNLRLVGDKIEPGTGLFGDSATYTTVNTALGIAYPDKNYFLYGEVKTLGAYTGMYFNQACYTRHVGYTELCYRDKDGQEHTINTTGSVNSTQWANESGQAITTETGSTRLQYRDNIYKGENFEPRLDALDQALQSFAQMLANETNTNGIVENRVAVVGFSNHDGSTHNTEILSGVNLQRENVNVSSNVYHYFPRGYNYNGAQVNDPAALSSAYGTALIRASTQKGVVNPALTSAIQGITAYGTTHPEDGMAMAREILNNRTETTYTLKYGENAGQEVPRGQVVIFFTDGEPGDYSWDNQYEYANLVVEEANKLKTLNGAKVFTIGVFGKSDAEPMTYTAAELASKNDDLEYEYGWVKTLDAGTSYPPRYKYLNRQWRANDVTNYGETPNDTIYDYMSVVSSNYPNAEKFLSDEWLNGTETATYKNMSESVRHSSTSLPKNEYYRLASSRANLIEAFESAVITSTQDIQQRPYSIEITEKTVLKDFINTDNFQEINPNNIDVTVKTISMTQENADSDPIPGAETQTSSSVSHRWDNNTLIVEGYDYIGHCVSPNKNDSEKLVVTISGLIPNDNVTGHALESNLKESGMYETEDTDLIKEFPVPTISRHSYTLNCDQKTAKFAVSAGLALVSDSEAAVDPSDAALTNVIVVSPSGTREKYSVATRSYNNIQDSETFYYENVPDGYQVKTEIKSTDDTYTYTWTDNESVILNQTTAQTKNYNYVNSTIDIASEANNREAVVTMTTKGVDGQADYSDKTKQFPVTLALAKGGTPYAETSIADATITRQDGTTETATLNFANGSCSTYTVGGKTENLTLANGEQVMFQAPAGYTLTVVEGDHEKYTLTYKTSDNATPGDSNNAVVINEVPNQVDVINTLTENPDIDSGVLDSSNPLSKLLYVMAGMCGIAALAFAIYGRKRKVF